MTLILSKHGYIMMMYRSQRGKIGSDSMNTACWSCSLTDFVSLAPASRDLLSALMPHSGLEEEEGEHGDLSFLQDLLSPGAASRTDEFSQAWQDAFGCFEAPASAPSSTHTAAASSTAATRSSSQPPSPTGFLPSQLLDHGISATG